MNATGGGGGNVVGGGTYHTTAEDGRRRHSFNAHDKSGARQAADSATRLGGGSHAAQASRAPCRRANSTAAPKSRYVLYRTQRRVPETPPRLYRNSRRFTIRLAGGHGGRYRISRRFISPTCRQLKMSRS